MDCYLISMNSSYAINTQIAKIHGANMGPTWALPVPDGPHVCPMNIAVRVGTLLTTQMNMMFANCLGHIKIPNLWLFLEWNTITHGIYQHTNCLLLDVVIGKLP